MGKNAGNQRSITTRMRKGFMVFMALGITVVLALAGCSQQKKNPAQGAQDKIRAIVAENFYAEVVQAVGGDRVQVECILTSSSQDPHDFEPTLETAKNVSKAQIIIYNGLGYDDWMEKMVKSSSEGKKIVIAVGKDLMVKTLGDNPHVWYDPGTMPKLAERLAIDLATIDPAHAAQYKDNAQKYINSLTPLSEKVRKLKQPTPVPVAVSEPVFGYMADELNFQIVDAEFAKAIEEEIDPAAADVAKIQEDVKNKRMKMFIYNTQSKSAVVENLVKLAKDNQIPVIAVTETSPSGKDYLSWLMGELDQIEQALRGK